MSQQTSVNVTWQKERPIRAAATDDLIPGYKSLAEKSGAANSRLFHFLVHLRIYVQTSLPEWYVSIETHPKIHLDYQAFQCLFYPVSCAAAPVTICVVACHQQGTAEALCPGKGRAVHFLVCCTSSNVCPIIFTAPLKTFIVAPAS